MEKLISSKIRQIITNVFKILNTSLNQYYRTYEL